MDWQAVLSGRKRGIAAGLIRAALAPLTPFYRVPVALRNLAYHHNWLKTHKVAVPVLSIGNFTTGGTGKTPLVAWVARILLDLEQPVGILSRGYRSLDESGNDEHRLLNELLPEVPHLQNRDSVARATDLIK